MGNSSIKEIDIYEEEVLVDDVNISKKIKNILSRNKLQDLNKFLNKRQCLNECNLSLVYIFHVVQTIGIFTTTIAAGFNMKELIWVGVSLNFLASLINIFEQTNNNISQRLLKDIISISNGTYIDEGLIVEPNKDNTPINNNNSTNNSNNTNNSNSTNNTNTINNSSNDNHV